MLCVLASFGSKVGIWSISVGLVICLVCIVVALPTLISSLIGLYRSFSKKLPRSLKRSFVLGSVFPLGLLGFVIYDLPQALSAPVLYNVSTDLLNPPQFSEHVLELREAIAANPVLLTDNAKDKIRRGYPNLKSLESSLPPDTLEQLVETTIHELGWKFHGKDTSSENQKSVTLYATDTSFWFGFKDDVAIRLVPHESGGTILDVHSVSRVGVTDLGKNAERIEELFASLR